MSAGYETSKTMPAILCYGSDEYRLEEQRTPRPGPGEVVVEVLSAGICASDLKCRKGAPMFWGDEHRIGYAEPPFIPGHEFVGRVVALGDGAAEKYKLELRDLAISEQIVPCWQCRFCRSGRYWMCAKHDIYGFKNYLPGSMAKYMRFPAGALVHKVPADVDPTHAAVIEPLSCSIHAVQRARIELGEVVVVAGCGTLGLGMVGAARLKNPGLLIAMDLMPHRLEAAKKLGADMVMNPSEEDVIARVRELTDGYGCDVYIEASGHVAAVEQGLHMLRRLGRMVEFSVFGEPVKVDWTIIGDTKELDIYGSHLGPYCYPLAIDYIHRKVIDVSPIVTHVLPMAEHSRAFEMMFKGDRSIKVQLQP